MKKMKNKGGSLLFELKDSKVARFTFGVKKISMF